MMVAFAMVALLSSRYRSGAAVLFFVASSIHEVRWVVYPGTENFRWDVESGDSLCAAVARRVSAVARRVATEARRVATEARRVSAVARRVATEARRVATEARRVSADVRRVAPHVRSPSGSGRAYTKNAPGKPRGWLVGRLRPTTAVDHHHVGLVLTPEQGEDLPLGDGVVEALHLIVFIVGDEVAAVAERPDVAREALFSGDGLAEADQVPRSHLVAVDGVDGEGAGSGGVSGEAGHWNLLVSWWCVSLSV